MHVKMQNMADMLGSSYLDPKEAELWTDAREVAGLLGRLRASGNLQS